MLALHWNFYVDLVQKRCVLYFDRVLFYLGFLFLIFFFFPFPEKCIEGYILVQVNKRVCLPSCLSRLQVLRRPRNDSSLSRVSSLHGAGWLISTQEPAGPTHPGQLQCSSSSSDRKTWPMFCLPICFLGLRKLQTAKRGGPSSEIRVYRLRDRKSLIPLKICGRFLWGVGGGEIWFGFVIVWQPGLL